MAAEETGFLGAYHHSLDENGRLIIPSKFRSRLEGKVFICRGQNNKCLYLYPRDEWEKFVKNLQTTIPINDRAARQYITLLMGTSSDPEIDRQGRIPIPQDLRTFAGIKGEVVSVGSMRRIEIWNADAWKEFEQSVSFDQITDEVAGKYQIYL